MSAPDSTEDSPSELPPAKPVVRRKKRKLAGEDDTDCEIRLAREDAVKGSSQLLTTKQHHSDEPPTDLRGHVSLFPEERRRSENPVTEDTNARSRNETYHQDAIPLSSATGMDSTSRQPWYTASPDRPNGSNLPSKDVWGNEDPRRKERDHQRLTANDPLTAMKRGIQQLRKAERHRKEWMVQREMDLNEVEQMAKRDARRGNLVDSDDGGSLENFKLDSGYSDLRERHRRRKKHRPSHHGGRHRERGHSRAGSPRR